MLPNHHPRTASTNTLPEICVYRRIICVDLCPVMACTVMMGMPFSQNRLVGGLMPQIVEGKPHDPGPLNRFAVAGPHAVGGVLPDLSVFPGGSSSF